MHLLDREGNVKTSNHTIHKQIKLQPHLIPCSHHFQMGGYTKALHICWLWIVFYFSSSILGTLHTHNPLLKQLLLSESPLQKDHNITHMPANHPAHGGTTERNLLHF